MSRKNKAVRLNNEGNAQYQAKRYDEAVALYTKAIESDAAFAVGYSNRAQALYQRKSFARAVEDSMLAVQLDPTQWKSLLRAGRGYVALGRCQEAIQCFASAKLRFPDVAECVNIADFEVKRVEWVVEKMSALDPLMRRMDWVAGLAAVQTLREHAPQCYDLVLTELECLLRLREYSEAVKLAVEAQLHFFEGFDAHCRTLLGLRYRALALCALQGVAMATRRGLWEQPSEAEGDSGATAVPTVYTALGVALDCSQDEVVEAMTERNLTGIGSGKTDAAAAAAIEPRVAEAYVILSDPTMRALVDAGVPPHTILSPVEAGALGAAAGIRAMVAASVEYIKGFTGLCFPQGGQRGAPTTPTTTKPVLSPSAIAEAEKRQEQFRQQLLQASARRNTPSRSGVHT